jgi:hypothetical protein
MRSFVAALAAAGAVGVSAPTDAAACSLPPPLGIRSISPDDGATAVPTNVRPRVVSYGRPWTDEDIAALEDLVVRPPGGQPVTAVVQVGRTAFQPLWRVIEVIPDAPLQPDTTYELAGKVRLDCSWDCVAATYQVYRTFRTGADPDTTPPTFAGATGVRYGTVEHCTSSACCGPFVGQRFALEFDAASDPSGIAGYHIYRAGSLVARVGRLGHVLCEGSFTGGGPDADFVYQASGRYVVHAVDLAGNEDQNDQGVDVVIDCAAILAPDAGVPDAGPPDAPPPDAPPAPPDAAPPAPPDAAPDAPIAVDAATAPAPEDAGCAAGGRTPRGGVGPLILVLAAVALRRRSTRRRDPRAAP